MANSGTGNRFMSANLNRLYGQNSTSSSVHSVGRSKSAGHGGMLVLSRTRSQIAGQRSTKLSVPPPLNLPSLRREHGGGDLTHGQSSGQTSSGSGVFGWSKLSSASANGSVSHNAEHVVSGLDGSAKSGPDSAWGTQVQSGIGSSGSAGEERDTAGSSLGSGDRPRAYMPPAARTTPPQSCTTQAERSVLLKGEDFPSLQAAVTHPSSMQHKQKDAQQKERKHQEALNEKGYTLPQYKMSDESLSHETLEDQFRPKQPRHPSKENDSSVYGFDQNSKMAERHSLGPLPFVKLDHTSNWADDERDTGRSFRAQEHERNYESYSHDNLRYRVNGMSGTLAREYGSFNQRDIDSSKYVQRRGLRADKDEIDHPPFRAEKRNGTFEKEVSFGSNMTLNRDRGLFRQGIMPKENRRDYEVGMTKSRSLNGHSMGKSWEPDYIRGRNWDLVGSEPLNRYQGHDQGHFVSSGKDTGFGKTHNDHGIFGRNRGLQNEGLQSKARDRSTLSSNTRVMNLDDPILDFGRDKRSTSSKPYRDDPFTKDIASLSGFDTRDPFLGAIGTELRIPRRKKSDSRQLDVRDPIRESFEAELERVQKLQEQERQRIIEEQERARELARKEEEERLRLAREEEERQRRLEEEAREAAWRAEQEKIETARRLEEERRAREEEKRRIILEEERRKEAAKRKLIELEEKIAKRQAENRKDEETRIEDNNRNIIGKTVNDKNVMKRVYRSEWEEEERTFDRITSSASSESSNPSRLLESGMRPPMAFDSNIYPSDRRKPVAPAYRRQAFDNGNLLSQSSHALATDQSSYYHNDYREPLHGGRSLASRDSYEGSRSHSNKYLSKAGRSDLIQINDNAGYANVQRWSRDEDGLQFSKSSDVESEIIGNEFERYSDIRWGQDMHDSWRGRERSGMLSAAGYSQISEVGDFSSGRSRHSVRQPRVLPPPSVPVLPKGLPRNDTEKSSYLAEDEVNRGPSPVKQDSSLRQDNNDNRSISESPNRHGFEDIQEASYPRQISPSMYDGQDEAEAFEYLKNETVTVTMPNYDIGPGFTDMVEAGPQSQDMVTDSKLPEQDKHEEWVIEDENDFGEDDEEEESDTLFEEEVTYEKKEKLMENKENKDFHGEQQKNEIQSVHQNVCLSDGAEVEKHMISDYEDIVASDNASKLQGEIDGSLQRVVVSNDQISSTADDAVKDIQEEQSLEMENKGFTDRNELSNESESCIDNQVGVFQASTTDESSLLSVESLTAGQPDSGNSMRPAVESSQQSAVVGSLPSSQETLTPSSQEVLTTATSMVPSLVSPVPTLPKQSDFPVKLQFGLLPGHSILPATVPAIQIGSIQMPLHLHPQVSPSLTQMPSAQAPLFSLGQVRFPSSMSQGLLPLTQQAMPFMHPTVSPHYPLGGQPQLPLPTQQILEAAQLQPSANDTQQITQTFQSDMIAQPPKIDGEHKGITHFDHCKESKDVLQNNRVLENKPCTNIAQKSSNTQSLFIGSDHVGLWPSTTQDESAVSTNTQLHVAQNSVFDEQTKSRDVASHTYSASLQPIRTAGQGKGNRTMRDSKTLVTGHSGGLPAGKWSPVYTNNKLRRQGRRSSRRNDYQGSGEGGYLETYHSTVAHKNEIRPFDAHGEHGTTGSLSGKGIRNDPGLNANNKSERSSGSKLPSKNGLQLPTAVASRSSEGLQKRHGKLEVPDEDSLQSGVVRIYKQSGIETPSDVDDFIEVRSKRQMLNDRREQREKESKAKSKEFKVARKQRLFGKVSNQRAGAVNSELVVSNERVVSDASSSASVAVSTVNQHLAPIGTPSVQMDGCNERKTSPKSLQSNSGCNERKTSPKSLQSNSVSVLPHTDTEDKTTIFENQPAGQENVNGTALGAWGSSRSNQQVVSLTQIQLEEVMRPTSFEPKHTPILPEDERSGMTSDSGLSMSSILEQKKKSSSGVPPLTSFLGGEKIQFGAVTPPTLLSPVGGSSSTLAVSSGHAASMACRTAVSLENKLPSPKADSSFFNKSDDRCEHSIDADAEAEAAASAVAVAAITSDESVGSCGLGSTLISAAESKGFGNSHEGASLIGASSLHSSASQTRGEESMTVMLPADLSVENPTLSFWSPMQNRQTSSGPIHPHFPATPHFPCFEMGPMLGSPIFAFGQQDEASLSQGQKTTTSLDQGLSGIGAGAVGGWQQCHSGVDSFYGVPPSGFTGPFVSPSGGIPGIQAPPHMFVYTNPFTPVGQFGQLGLSFMGTTYIPSGKQPDWKHTPVSTSGAAVSEGDISNLGMISAQRSSVIPNVQQMSSPSSVMPVASNHGLFDINLTTPFQTSAELPMQVQWSYNPSSQLHSMPMTTSIGSLSMPNQQEDSLSAQLSHPGHTVESGGNMFHQLHGPKSVSNEPFSTIDAAAQFPDELGLGDGISNSDGSLLSSRMSSSRTVYNSGSSANMKAQKNKNISRPCSSGIGGEGNDFTSTANATVMSSTQSLHGNRTVGSHLHSQANIQKSGSSQYSPLIGYMDQKGSVHPSTGHKQGGTHEWSGHGHRKTGGQGRSQISGDKNPATTKIKQVYVVKPSSLTSSSNAGRSVQLL